MRYPGNCSINSCRFPSATCKGDSASGEIRSLRMIATVHVSICLHGHGPMNNATSSLCNSPSTADSMSARFSKKSLTFSLTPQRNHLQIGAWTTRSRCILDVKKASGSWSGAHHGIFHCLSCSFPTLDRMLSVHMDLLSCYVEYEISTRETQETT